METRTIIGIPSLVNKDIDFFEYVSFYNALGFSIIPIKKGTKRPLISWKKELTFPVPIEKYIKWFHNLHVRDIAILCGHVSNNLVVIDIDDQELADLCFKYFPKTFTVQTRKGLHFYYFSDLEINTQHLRYQKKTEKILSVDIIGKGGYVLCPPSNHPTIFQYHVKLWETVNYITMGKITNWITYCINSLNLKRIKSKKKQKQSSRFSSKQKRFNYGYRRAFL